MGTQTKKNIPQPVAHGCARVPVILQLEALECGAACLAMVLAYYRRWEPLEQVRIACGVSRDGSRASNLLRAARGYGLCAKGYRYEPQTLRENATFPCIIHWNFNHFVVLCGFRHGKALLNDPARGSCAVSMEEFDRSFTGVCILLAPGESFVPGGKPKSVLSFAKKRLQGTAPLCAFAVLSTVLLSLVQLMNPAFSRVFLDRLLTQQNPEWLGPFLVLMSAVAAVQLIVAFLRAVYLLKLNGKLAMVANATYLWHVLRLPMEFFGQRLAGDILARQSTNQRIASGLAETLAPLLLDSCMMVFYLTVMLRYSPLLTAVGLAGIVLDLLMARIISRQRVNISRVLQRDSGKLAGATVAGVEMIETIKSAGAENGFFQRWAGYQASVNTQKVRFLQIDQSLGLVPVMVSTLTNSAVLLLGVWLTLQGQFTPGMIFAFQGLVGSFMAPAGKLIGAGQTMQELRTDMERVEDVMTYPEASFGTDDAPAQFDKLTGTVELRNVTFGYSRLEPPLIENFSLHLQPGSHVAFVGESGCGKSTLAKLISGLYEPWSGEILFDGKPIRAINRSVFTGSLAVVDQDITLFEDTIANNIKMWDTSIEDFEMIMAARDAQLHADILQREGGYEHRLAEGGRDLSGGQRQRLEIARVLAQDPTILILDEATSALDAKTEYEVVRSIENRGITTIVVAHRLSTIRSCNEIIVLQNGKVAERGTHEALVAQGGLYQRLVCSE